MRRAAVTCIAVGTAPEELRGYARQWPGSRYAPWWPAVARDVEALTARGLTARHAERALRDGDPEVRTSWTASAPGARKAAKIFAAVVTSGDVRDMARGAPAPSKPMLRARSPTRWTSSLRLLRSSGLGTVGGERRPYEDQLRRPRRRAAAGPGQRRAPRAARRDGARAR